MPEHTLHYSFSLDLPRGPVFEFCSDAANLGRLAPPELEFSLITPLPVEMREGAVIAFRVKLFGFPLTWVSRITAWSPPDLFVEEQMVGPYRQWTHRHTFRDGPHGGTIVDDEVRFLLPVAPLGEAAFPMVRKQLDRIFSYREETVTFILRGGTAG
jgi:ligand-binding SRPBCC domain-containing protein